MKRRGRPPVPVVVFRKQGTLLKALLADEDFRAPAGELIVGSIYKRLQRPRTD